MKTPESRVDRQSVRSRSWGCRLSMAAAVGLFAFFAAASGSAQNLEFIRSAILSGNTENKRNALDQIRNIHTETASRIALPALSDADELVRSTAASAVVFLPKSEAANALRPLLNDKAEFVRSEAALAIGRVGDKSASVSLVHALQQDSSIPVRSAAAFALGELGDPVAVEALVSILKKRPSPRDEFLRRSIARSIGQIAQIIGTGKVRVDTPQNFLPEKYKEKASSKSVTVAFPVFYLAVAALTDVLRNQKETDDTHREAAFALGAIGDRSSAEVLRSYLNSPDNYLAEICREALLKINQTQ